MKKILVFFTVIMLLAAFAVMTSCNAGDKGVQSPMPTEEPTEEPTEPTESEESALDFNTIPGDTVVGRMYICTQAVGLGHAWIYIESDFNGDMPVGCYTLKPY